MSSYNHYRNTTSISLTDEQNQFIKLALQGNNVLVDACIGSGKTTAIQQLCIRLAQQNKNVLYLTYNKLLKNDAQEKIISKNITVQNYHGYATKILKGYHEDCIEFFVQSYKDGKIFIPRYDVLVIDEYQDIETNSSEMLMAIKESNQEMQLIAVGDMKQKISNKTTLNVKEFIEEFLGDYKTIEFTRCFRLNEELATKLGRIWDKKIIGVNKNCVVETMDVDSVVPFLAQQDLGDILCLGKPYDSNLSKVLNKLESEYPDKFNLNTVYAKTKDSQGSQNINSTVAIFTTYDGSKGLERNICVIFDYTKDYWEERLSKIGTNPEILQNIFCVAASRGKRKIIFVYENEDPLTEELLKFPSITVDKGYQTFNISNMFNFKYDEDINKCYSLLTIKRILLEDSTKIDIKTNDGQIDLCPFIETYQIATYFNKYSIDEEINECIAINKNIEYMVKKYHPNTLEEKTLLLMAMTTSQERYIKQVNPNFISESQRKSIVTRLKMLLNSEEEFINKPCELEFTKESGETLIIAKGKASVVTDDATYLLKFKLNISKEDFLSCAFYAYLFGREKGILWNIYDNSAYEITINNNDAFINQVAVTISMGVLNRYYSSEDYEYYEDDDDNYNINFANTTHLPRQSAYCYSPAMFMASNSNKDLPYMTEADLSKIVIGARVIHRKFGEGVITNIDKVKKYVDVTFAIGEKTFLYDNILNFLEII